MSQREQNGIDSNRNGGGAGTQKRKSPEEIAAEITQTRSAITDDIQALGDKLSAEKLRETAKDVLHDAKQEAKNFVKETKDAAVDSLRHAKEAAVETVSETMHEVGVQARRAGGATARFVSANAVPLSLIGIGVAWLTLSARQRRGTRRDYIDYRYGPGARLADEDQPRLPSEYGQPTSSVHLGEEGARVTPDLRERAKDRLLGLEERARDIGERARDFSHDARERARDFGHDARERARDFGYDARERLHRMQDDAVEFANDNPLAVGAIAVAAGVGVGMLLPSTQPENRLLGDTRTQLVSQAREAAQRVGRTAKEAAQELKTAVTEST